MTVYDPLRQLSAAVIAAVEPESPADDAGFTPGCRIMAVDGQPLRDLIDWRWLTADDEITLAYIDLEGDEGEVDLVREPGEEWGISFEGLVFDEVRQCRNACTFCFMRQLPSGMRPSLTLRDDDFRLSFLTGTFVTFTNLTEADEQRIVEQRISPLRMSLHAVSDDVRRRLIGRHAAHGLEVLDRLLACGIEFHAQIVLVPGVNDGEELDRTLAWAYERPGILDVCIVPLGYTRHQVAFDHSFNEPAAARTVLEQLAPWQERAVRERGGAWAFAADEFYRNALGPALLRELPPASFYGDFAMFEDGVGIIRSFVDDWLEAERSGVAERCARALAQANVHVLFVAGLAMREFLTPLVEGSPLAGVFEPLYVENRFFGGNVDVTGLLCGCDIADAVLESRRGRRAQTVLARTNSPQDCSARCGAAQLVPSGKLRAAPPAGFSGIGALTCETGECHSERSEAKLSEVEESRVATAADIPGDRMATPQLFFAIPRVVFNDDAVTLDGMSLEEMEKRAGTPLAVVSCNASEYLIQIMSAVDAASACANTNL